MESEYIKLAIGAALCILAWLMPGKTIPRHYDAYKFASRRSPTGWYYLLSFASLWAILFLLQCAIQRIICPDGPEVIWLGRPAEWELAFASGFAAGSLAMPIVVFFVLKKKWKQEWLEYMAYEFRNLHVPGLPIQVDPLKLMRLFGAIGVCVLVVAIGILPASYAAVTDGSLKGKSGLWWEPETTVPYENVRAIYIVVQPHSVGNEGGPPAPPTPFHLVRTKDGGTWDSWNSGNSPKSGDFDKVTAYLERRTALKAKKVESRAAAL
jgi:hypothetical protein